MAKGGNGNVSVRNGGITDTTQAGTGRRNDRRLGTNWLHKLKDPPACCDGCSGMEANQHCQP